MILLKSDLNENYVLMQKNKNLSLLKFILYVVDTYNKLHYHIDYSELKVKISINKPVYW